ncbi:MAG: multicopper oxidase domain-containing protein, partial [Clostridium sp.]|nr:multicopper oxidase domain-containing protein [Clostridium sp.]
MKNRNKISISLIVLGLVLILSGVIAKSLINNETVLENNNTDGGFIKPQVESFGKLPIPVLLEDENSEEGVADFTLNATEGFTDFYENSITPTMGYNGTFLGPVIKVKKGDQVNMHVNNELSDSTSVHWHGLEVEGPKDGGPRQVIEKGETWNPSFTIEQPAATLWFHPHVMGTTATQVYHGLAGMMIVEDDVSEELNIPKEYGVNDIPLILQDRSFNQDGSFYYGTSMMMDGMLGDTQLVNGAITPNLD